MQGNPVKISLVLISLALGALLSSCSESPDQLQRILERGDIRIVTHDGPSTYFVDKDGENGLEYLLAEQFAAYLGVNLSLTITRTPSDALDFVRTLACARIIMPQSYLRLSAGREDMDDATQALCFFAGANSIFYGEKLLTTPNPDTSRDHELFDRLGLNAETAPH